MVGRKVLSKVNGRVDPARGDGIPEILKGLFTKNAGLRSSRPIGRLMGHAIGAVPQVSDTVRKTTIGISRVVRF